MPQRPVTQMRPEGYTRSSSTVVAALLVIFGSSCEGSAPPLAPVVGISVIAPQDTVIVLGASYRVRGDALYEDGSSGRVSLQSLDPDIVSTRDTVVTGEGYGRTRVLVAGGLDTLWVTVVPDATLAAYRYPDGLVTFRSDLTEMTKHFRAGDPGYETAHPAVADWDPAGHRVVFSLNGAIFFVALGGRPIRVTPTPDIIGAASHPQMTGDAAWIYFTSGSEVWRIRPNGAGAARVGRIPPAGYDDGLPSPSPSADRVAILTDPGPGPLSLLDILDPETGDIDPTGILARFARWSPVDDRIAYADENGELRLLELSSGQTRLIVRDGTTSHDRLHFDWSPDGDFLISTVSRAFPYDSVAEGKGALEIIQIETGVRMPIPLSQGMQNPAWGPSR